MQCLQFSLLPVFAISCPDLADLSVGRLCRTAMKQNEISISLRICKDRSCGRRDELVPSLPTETPNAIDTAPRLIRLRRIRSGQHFLAGNVGAEEGTRTPTAFRPPAPKAGASANSATSAWAQYSIAHRPQLSLPVRPGFARLRRNKTLPGGNHATLHEMRGRGRGQCRVLPRLRGAAISRRVSSESGGTIANG